jgi:hypothetical protein
VKLIDGFAGVLQVDRYDGYNALAERTRRDGVQDLQEAAPR